MTIDAIHVGSTPAVGRPRIRLRYRTIHGYRRAYRIVGSGPVVVLIHGIGDNSSTWEPIMTRLAARYTVIAPDLLGHGFSDKPRADYSVAAFANGVRDLLWVLGHERVTLVGHSLGGGVAMQFSYQYPSMVSRLVLVSAGGVTRDVSPALRLATLPGTSQALALLRVPGVMTALDTAARALAASPLLPGPAKPLSPSRHLIDRADLMRILRDLSPPDARAAFGRTLRAVVDWRGQHVSMLDRSYLTANIPVLVAWGTDDAVIPYRHAELAHAAIPGARLATFDGCGHFPFRDEPDRFARLVDDFIATSSPGTFDPRAWRTMLLDGADPVEQDSTGALSAETRSDVYEAMAIERSAT
ncbi:putative hydrolase [Gordonia araii NBRC 100433]|uniref:Putative hydrolase n=1 Tax=Gordonia araii NBRC 100433 TaxID=1073574 RepID=G7H271_9ACTN|nr:alpha/beta hydrolase [Gordonia araii]NNG97485.1 alpha/beta hydrolase [Gordonia araii NBRC 100433]GAB09946.1 putative hydrolase [Gordonia araii NBRC 100433]